MECSHCGYNASRTLKFPTAGCQANLTTFMIALFYSTKLFFIVASHSAVDMCTVDAGHCWSIHYWEHSLYFSCCKAPQLQQNVKLPSPIWEICNTLLWRFPTWGTVMKCLSKSNTEISAWAEICKGRHCHLISCILNKQRLCLNAVYKLGSL